MCPHHLLPSAPALWEHRCPGPCVPGWADTAPLPGPSTARRRLGPGRVTPRRIDDQWNGEMPADTDRHTDRGCGRGRHQDPVPPGAGKERATPTSARSWCGHSGLRLCWGTGSPCVLLLPPARPGACRASVSRTWVPSSPSSSLPPCPSSSLLFLPLPPPPPPGWLRASFSIWKPSLNTASRLEALSQLRGPAFSRNHFIPPERASALPTSTRPPADGALGEAHSASPGPAWCRPAGGSWARLCIFLVLVNKIHK